MVTERALKRAKIAATNAAEQSRNKMRYNAKKHFSTTKVSQEEMMRFLGSHSIISQVR